MLHLLSKTYKRLSDWEKLRKLLVDIKKQKVLPEDKILELEIETWCGLLDEYPEPNNYDALSELWDELPQHLKILPVIVEHYARLLIAINASEQAEKLLRSFLDKNWSESSIVLYSELDVQIDNQPLESAEKWLQDHQYNAYLLLALGKMCIRRTLWGKARSYLEASLAVSPMPVTYLQLAHLLQNHMHEVALAQENYRLGLQLLTGDSTIPVPVTKEADISLVEENKPNLKLV